MSLCHRITGAKLEIVRSDVLERHVVVEKIEFRIIVVGDVGAGKTEIDEAVTETESHPFGRPDSDVGMWFLD